MTYQNKSLRILLSPKGGVGSLGTSVLPEHQRAVPPDSKLGVLHTVAVLHLSAVAHHVAQTLAAICVEEAGVLGVQTPGSLGRLLHSSPLTHPAATRPARLQHRHRPQRVVDHRHVTWEQR